MNVQPSFQHVDFRALGELRERYLDGLLKGQEALLEVLVPHGEHYLILTKGQTAGYFILHDVDVLIEYYVLDEYLAYTHQFLKEFIEQRRVRSALVKSFDHMFLACAMDFQIGVKSKGVLVRDFIPRALPVIPSIRYAQRTATEDDLPRLKAVDQPVFTHPERLLAVVRGGHVRIFEHADRVIGFGILRPIIPGRPEVDLGIAVDRPFRNRGYAIYMLRDLAEYCAEHGLKPTAGCAIENWPSIKMGLRVGFISRYRLLELTFPNAQPGS